MVGRGLYLHRTTAAEAGQQLLAELAEYHRRAPESLGLAAEQLRAACARPKSVFDALVALLKSAGQLVESKGLLALAGHRPTLAGPDAARLEAIEAAFRGRPFSPPSAAEVAQELHLGPAAFDALLAILREQQRLVLVAEGLLFHREAIDRARELLVEHITKQGRLESVDFKYLLDTTRKFALPLLDYFDGLGFLRRVGNTRFLKNPKGT